jgi:site-specific recombinase XerD
MASCKYRLRTNNEMNAIFCRFKHSNKFDIELSIGISVPKGRWSKSKSQVLDTPLVDFPEINIQLAEFEAILKKEYEDYKLTDRTLIITKNWLAERIHEYFSTESKDDAINKKLYLVNFIDAYVQEAATRITKKGVPIKARTIQHYKTTKQKILNYQKYIDRKLTLKGITLQFHTAFIQYLAYEEKLGLNTIGNYIDDIKLFCKSAKLKGYKITNDYLHTDFFTPSNKTIDIYLNEQEINTIFNSTFSQEYLSNAKDWFIIGLRTGFRISDFLELTEENLVDGFIEKDTLKTGFPVIIPLHDQVISILQKRNGDFPRKISDQKFNEYIKIIAKGAGLTTLVQGARMKKIEITGGKGEKKIISRKTIGKYPKYELVTSHVCRRSFATNLYGKIETLTIMKITGHQTEQQFLAYIKITSREYAEKLKAHWITSRTLEIT